MKSPVTRIGRGSLEEAHVVLAPWLQLRGPRDRDEGIQQLEFLGIVYRKENISSLAYVLYSATMSKAKKQDPKKLPDLDEGDPDEMVTMPFKFVTGTSVPFFCHDQTSPQTSGLTWSFYSWLRRSFPQSKSV